MSQKNNPNGQSAAYYQTLIQYTSDLISVLNLDGTIRYESPSIEPILGYSPEDLLGRNAFELIHPDDALEVRQAIAQILQIPQTPQMVTFRFKHQAGHWRTLEANGRGLFEADQLTGVVVSSRDITHRQQTEAALQASEERLRLLVDNALDSVVTINRQGIITGWNSQAETTFGWQRHEVMGQKLSETMIPHQHRAAHERGLQHFLATGEGPVLNQRIEITALRRDGQEFPVELAISPVGSGEAMTFSAFIRDITRRKEAEQVRQQAHEELERQVAQRTHDLTEANQDLLKFKLGIERSSDAIFLTDINGAIIYANPAFEKVYGYTREEAIGQTPRIIKSGFIPPEGYQNFWATLLSKGSVTGELVNKAKDGRLVHIAGNNTAIVDEQENIIGFLATHHDITEQKQAEEALAHERNLLQIMVHNLPDQVYIKDAQSRFLLINDPVRRHLGLASLAEAIGKTDFDFSPPELASQYYADEQKLLQSGQPFTDPEQPILDQETGQIKWVSSTKAPFRDAQGQVAGLVGLNRDITERKEIEEAFERERALLRSVIDSIPDLIFYKDANSVYLGCNKAFEEFTGRLESDLVNHTDVDLFGIETGHFSREMDRQMMAEGQAHHNEEWVNYPDGRLVLLDTLKTPFYNQQGQLLGLIGISRDITERKQAEIGQEYQARSDNLFGTISTNFLNLPANQTDQGIDEALANIGEFAGVDRAYLFLYAQDNLTMDNTHEWCAEGIETHKDRLKNIPINAFPYLQQRLSRLEPLYAPRMADLPPEARLEKEEFEREGIQSIICVPLISHAQAIGFLGFDAVRQEKTWGDDDINLLKRTGNLFVTALQRRQTEDALAKRATELETVAQVSTAAATILEANTLLPEVVNLTKRSFGLYHAHIYLLNEAGDTLMLAAGAGEVGQRMVAQGWNIPMRQEQSLVTQVARTRQGVIVNNVGQAPGFLPNPLLPDTQAEMAVPLLVGNQTLGVLDVQADKINYFTQDDLRIYTTLAAQISVALQNARLFAQAQRQTRQEQLLREITARVRNSTDPDIIIRSAVRELGQALDRPTFIRLGSADRLRQPQPQPDSHKAGAHLKPEPAPQNAPALEGDK